MSVVYVFLVLAFIFLFFGKKYQNRKRRANMVISIQDDRCARCRSCVKKCGHDVLKMVYDDAGAHVEIVNPEQCTACGHCIEVCHFDAMKLVPRNA